MKPKEDPALKAQEEQSRLEQVEAIQQDVTRRTNDSMRRYGNRSASAPIMR